MNKSKIYMIACICILFLSVLGSSIAYYREELFTKNASTITYGLDYYINYAKGQDITGAELLPVLSYTDGTSSDVEFWKIDNTYDIYGHIYLDINEIGPNLSNDSSLKYTLVNNNQIISQGTLGGNRTGDSILVSANIPLQTTKQLYTIYIWLDINENPDVSIESETLSLTVRCEATMKPIEAEVNLLNHINSLYIANYDSAYDVAFADGTGMNYYAPNVRLMSDGLDATGTMTNDPYRGNIRYYGADDTNLKNYIYFNCTDYNNQSSSTCEVWRIIGIVDGKVKLIRSSSLGDYSWDYTSTGECDNNWSDATLNTLLNTTYYNSTSTTYYNEDTTGETVSFASSGITKTTRDNGLISSSTWYTNEMFDYEVYIKELYTGERTGGSTWIGNIGLAYPSDYGYSADLNSCTNTIYNYYDELCLNTNWLTSIFTADSIYWLLTPSVGSVDAWFVDAGYVYNEDVGVTSSLHSVLPVLYLDPEVIINKGNGSSSNPYQIYVEDKITLLEHITNLYTENYDSAYDVGFASDDDASVNYYAPTVRLMNDGLDNTGANVSAEAAVAGTAGNIRYYGADDENLKNYIYFNCTDYNNQSSSTCETWRIIGIVDGKVKLIRSESLGNYSWDYNADGTGDATWPDATLNTLLNNAYYKSGTTTHYHSGNTAGTSVSFSTNGITAATRGLISPSTWYINRIGSPDIYADYAYEQERTGGSTWTGNIGIPYASDYGYAADLNSCTNNLFYYSGESCTSVNWQTSMFLSSDDYWLITPAPASGITDVYVWYIFERDLYDLYYDYDKKDAKEILPVLYLKPNLGIKVEGDGSSTNPFQLDV